MLTVDPTGLVQRNSKPLGNTLDADAFFRFSVYAPRLFWPLHVKLTTLEIGQVGSGAGGRKFAATGMN